MQVAEQKKTILVSPELHDRIGSLRSGNQTYGDVVEFAIHSLIQSNQIIPKMFESMSTIGAYQLKKPLEFDVYFDSEDAIWCVENKELSILGCGNNIFEIISSLEDEIECYIVGFLLRGNSNIENSNSTSISSSSNAPLSKNSLLLKEKLSEYVDFDVLLSIYMERYGDDSL